MNRPHCDLCDALVQPYPKWCELPLPNGKTSTIHVRPIISGHAGVDPDYCITCWQTILSKLLEDSTGMHNA